MELYGRNYGFRLTVGAACEIAERCPGGDIRQFAALVSGDGGLARATEGRAAFVCALSRGWEETRAFTEPGYEPRPLTPQLLMTLSVEDFNGLLEEAIGAFGHGSQTTVAVAPAKKNGDGGGATSG